MKLSSAEFFEHSRKHLPGTLVAFDFADFKRYNDALGHSVGDDAIAVFEAVLEYELKSPQAFSRVGGGSWLALLNADPVETLTRVLGAFGSTTSRRIGWSGNARRGTEIANATETTPSSIHRAMRCLYASVVSPSELARTSDTLLESCHGFDPSSPVALQDLKTEEIHQWQSVSQYPTVGFYCPLCRGTTFDWTDGDMSMYGAEGNCHSCHAEVRFRNVNVDA